MNVSIVIPVYNEAEHLAACLQAIAKQTVAPYEVIVVDNNSTDKSANVAKSFDFVRLLHEPKQGVVHARTAGFDAVTGEVIARIDADSILPDDWIASVMHVFDDEELVATSGIARYYNVAAAQIFNAIDIFFRRRLHRQLDNRMYLWGANMAMRRAAWDEVKSLLCARKGQHEDYDLAIHLQELGHKVTFNEIMSAHVSSRRIDISYGKFMRYVWVSPDTYAQHGIRSRRHMYPIVFVCALGYLPARILHRGYNPTQKKFSWNHLLTMKPVSPPRVDPTTNVA
jgi:glycosyltransferase involved in cell wall biosynthesis